jgi:hypothetical protein
LSESRLRYNEAVRQTWNEQFLLNIVRLRYRDPAQFDAVANILASYQFDASINESEQFRTQSLPPRVSNSSLFNQHLLGAGGGLQERPSVTFTPLEGAEFTQHLLGPVHLETLVVMAHTGWDIDRVTRLTVQEMNRVENVKRVVGDLPEVPRFEAFVELARLLRDLQERGLMEFAYEEVDKPLSEPTHFKEHDFTVGALMTAADQKSEFRREEESHAAAVGWPALAAGTAGLIGAPRGVGPLLATSALLAGSARVTLWGKERHPVMRLAPGAWDDPIVQEVGRRLGLAPGVQTYRLIWGAETGQLKAPPSPGTDVVVSTRSALGMLLFVAKSVEVPPKDMEQGLVRDPVGEGGQPFDWGRVMGDLIRVHSQRTKPKHAFVATKYRGWWFYIDDDDLASKSTFALVLNVFGLEMAGGVIPSPVLAVPAGSRGGGGGG